MLLLIISELRRKERIDVFQCKYIIQGYQMAKDKTTYVWKDRKRIIFGLPWSFTVYKLTEEKLFVETGFFSKKEEEIRLYRVMDLTLKRPFGQRIWGLGTIHCCTAELA